MVVEDRIEETVKFEDAKKGIKYTLKESGLSKPLSEMFEKQT